MAGPTPPTGPRIPGILDAFEWCWLPWKIDCAIVFFVDGLAELQLPPIDMPVAD